jgi:hypothetical protein
VENVKHHIREEEEHLFPESLVLDLDWEALSAKVEKKKAQLTSQKQPPKRQRKALASRCVRPPGLDMKRDSGHTQCAAARSYALLHNQIKCPSAIRPLQTLP